MSLTNKETALLAANAISQKKGLDIVVLDIGEKSSFADYFVIASGNTERQVGGLVDEVDTQLEKAGILPDHIEGKPDSGWVLMDYGDVIVNVFTKEKRDLYQIEKIWGDGEFLEFEQAE
ncbi:MAG: ribosome silencing factor [Clostridiales Family XIII bacterium]|nr:ribosome silencing factor [Clostridiales Family XIII bacterium]